MVAVDRLVVEAASGGHDVLIGGVLMVFSRELPSGLIVKLAVCLYHEKRWLSGFASSE